VKKCASIIVFALICFFQSLLIQSAEKEPSIDLSQILEKAAEYCKRLDQVALHFVCNEEIEERIYSGRFFKRSTFVYDYQLIRKKNNIQEQRILLEECGEKKHEENAELKTRRFAHSYVIFGPIGLLAESQQKRHDYAIKKEEKYKGDKCYVIEVIPKPDTKIDGLFGKAWVRQDDWGIMKIEWNQQSMGNIEKIEEDASRLGAKPKITFSSEYGFEKNGIRFPSRYTVKEEYVRRTREKISETTVVYKDYKFFIVETEVKIK
jgi:hypothetical protein